MATFTTITDGQLDQDSPITEPLMTALRDNPIAIAQGDSTVPAANRVLSPALALSFQTGTATRTTTGTSTIVTLDTTDLSDLADMGVALLTGTVVTTATDPADQVTGTIISNQISTPSEIISFSGGQGGPTFSFSYLVELSSATSVNLRMSISTASGTSEATAYGQIIILGR